MNTFVDRSILAGNSVCLTSPDSTSGFCLDSSTFSLGKLVSCLELGFPFLRLVVPCSSGCSVCVRIFPSESHREVGAFGFPFLTSFISPVALSHFICLLCTLLLRIAPFLLLIRVFVSRVFSGSVDFPSEALQNSSWKLLLASSHSSEILAANAAIVQYWTCICASSETLGNTSCSQSWEYR